MYSTFYSTPGIVLYYLIRRLPAHILRIQSGGFGPVDRIFFNLEMSFGNSLNVLSDVKELIPDFYQGSGDFLVNTHVVNLGKDHNDEQVGDVTLPDWADSVAEFMATMRRALESDHVSANLHHWIDLIFGFKARGEEAFYANNVFNPTVYEGGSKGEASAMLANQFGQAPKQLFTEPHPVRLTRRWSGDPVTEIQLLQTELERLETTQDQLVETQ